jgi:hypothetical protein
MSILQKLTEGIVKKNLKQEGAALLDKWERTGLLEGLSGRNTKQTMARLLENQAAELLREASSMSAGDVEGFASVAFPIVRRVFGGLVANDLVSVQPMSLPSGLIFFLDFQYTDTRLDYRANDSLYGGSVVGRQLTGGVNIGQPAPASTNTGAGAEKGFYGLNNGYTSPTGSALIYGGVASEVGLFATGSTKTDAQSTSHMAVGLGTASIAISAFTENDKMAVNYDPDLLSMVGTSKVIQADLVVTAALAQTMDLDNLVALAVSPSGTTPALFDLDSGGTPVYLQPVRRLTKVVQGSGNDDVHIRFTFVGNTSAAINDILNPGDAATTTLSFPLKDNFTTGPELGAVVGADQWGLELAGNSTNSPANKDKIPEIDIKVDSVAVTAITKKLKAKWTPELGQDLNAYHNLDAEVELTSVLSEHIALEIDQELLSDLVNGAKAGTYYWSRRPGQFINRTDGSDISALANESMLGADFTGTVSEWYETLVETINDVSAQIHRKTLRGGANFIVVSPEVANILEFTSGFRANVTLDDTKGMVGAVKSGSLSKKWDVYVDPYFERNVVLIGRKGGSFLESGYVYAPYVPLQVTPTIFGTEDFVPRKGVMTRYAKKMVRPDMYGLVIVKNLLG